MAYAILITAVNLAWFGANCHENSFGLASVSAIGVLAGILTAYYNGKAEGLRAFR